MGRVKSKQLHLLPRLSCWLAAGLGPAPLQPTAWRRAQTHTHNWTAHIKTTTLTGLAIFAVLFFLREKGFPDGLEQDTRALSQRPG